MSRRLAATYAGYLLVVGFLVFTPGDGAPGGLIQFVLDGLSSVGLADANPLQVDFVLNIFMFVPLSLIGVFLFNRPSLPLWTAIGLAATVFIELTQLFFLPLRVASWSDVLANTLGAVIGAGLAIAVRRSRLVTS